MRTRPSFVLNADVLCTSICICFTFIELLNLVQVKGHELFFCYFYLGRLVQ